MNKTSAYVWLAVAVVVLIAIIVLWSGSPSPVGTSPTPTGTTNTPAATSGGTTGNENTERTGKAPTAVTVGFAGVSSTTATVVGSVIPNNAATTYWFEYGTTISFGTTADAQPAGSGSVRVGAATYLTGLKPGTQYYFRIGAQNAYGRSYGSVYSLITASK